MTEINPLLATRVKPGDEYYIFEKDPSVTREHVYYKTRYGVEIAADLYYAKDLDKNTKSPALVIGPPFGGVKEQGPGIYANQLAQRGFVVVAFDPAYHGYSGGYPRYSGSPDTYVEDFSAAVDYLGTVDFVDRNRIGGLGICASGGFVLSAAAQDSRLKAVATSVMYDIPHLANLATGETRAKQVAQFSQQRWTDRTAAPQNYPSHPVTEYPAGLDAVSKEFFSFYGFKRGWHPHALKNITYVSNLSFMNFEATRRINEIAPRPIFMVTSAEAHSKAFTDETFARLNQPKYLDVEPHGQHVDFYDNIDIIPFDKFEKFFKENL
ncbi:alpha beta superfamily hydrolase [Lactobacillus selangorensis]|uniref:Alpha beta superfamily hydrolase n=1 Tax=Lactobacillus selangorensis TaxID=81857 RepID=A0A0R2FRD2_9LACO|nr:alpha/beta hydrolase [Lactobacillus selangorensis]KRN28080.1 alpha beta superfamily hydrolase [Lactobacillus selangorensis]KRN31042.1 alpha beta superfamily hydrolase [Lactobacillus selangorensis]